MEPCIPHGLVPHHLRDRFKRGLLRSTRWAHLIIDAFPHDDLRVDDVNEYASVKGGGKLSNEEMEDNGTLEDEPKEEQKNVELVWDDGLSSNPIGWRPMSRAC
jgi:hypothetical protein